MAVRKIGFRDGRYLVTGEGRPRFFTDVEKANAETRARRARARGGSISGTKGRKLSQKSLDRR